MRLEDCFFDDQRHGSESDFSFQEGVDDNFVGGVEDAGDVAALCNRFIGEGQVGEIADIGFFKGEVRIFPEVQSGKVIGNSFRKSQCIEDGEPHIRESSCAFMEPSRNCTIEWMMDWGWTITSIFFGGRPNNQWASIISKPLFMRVAESMVILAPISQLGWARASVG